MLTLNQGVIEGLYSRLDLQDRDAVFSYVFNQLPAYVKIYPTENYFYFSFYAESRYIWGNIRLATEDRDEGIVHFAYFEYNDRPAHPDDFFSQYRRYQPGDGVDICKLDNFRYRLSHRGKSVEFQLNEIEQTPPRLFSLRADEVFVSRNFDESGIQFFLIFDRGRSHFLWVLNEESDFPGTLEPLSRDLSVDRLSDFVFYLDRPHHRKILVGVNAQNVKRNNYYDGPFDQQADNYLAQTEFARYVQQAYAYTRERINKYGVFTDQPGVRVSITPYQTYYAYDEIIAYVEQCKQGDPAELYARLAYDYKTSLPIGRRALNSSANI